MTAYSESDTRAKLITPALHRRGWGEDNIRRERADAFAYKNQPWLSDMPAQTAAAMRAIVGQFEKGGIDELENRRIFQTPAVAAAGGITALRVGGAPEQLLAEAKRRVFAA